MRPGELNEIVRARPFVPFRLHVTGGVTYDILNPEFILVGRSLAALLVRRDPNSPIFDLPSWVNLVHITQIEPLEVPTASAPPAPPQT
ncbi:MAG: hypothetical protein C0501_15240 [Isosphaera sp.]|nr:hypothetical protein [Isosphaera sp.]